MVEDYCRGRIINDIGDCAVNKFKGNTSNEQVIGSIGGSNLLKRARSEINIRLV